MEDFIMGCKAGYKEGSVLVSLFFSVFACLVIFHDSWRLQIVYKIRIFKNYSRNSIRVPSEWIILRTGGQTWYNFFPPTSV